VWHLRIDGGGSKQKVVSYHATIDTGEVRVRWAGVAHLSPANILKRTVGLLRERDQEAWESLR